MKSAIEPLNREEMDKLIEASKENEFFYMLLMVAKTTGRRLGELYGVQVKKKIGEKRDGNKTRKVYDRNGNKIIIPKMIPVTKNTNEWHYGVKVKDIDFKRNIMKIWVLKRRSYTQDETILLPEISDLIKDYIHKHNLKDDDYLFRKYYYRHIQYLVNHFAKKAGIKKKVSMHTLRHFFITGLLKEGWHHNQIAKLTGHKSIGTVMLYDHVIADDLREKAIPAIRNL